MKDISSVLVEVSFTVLVAGALTALLAAVILYVAAQLGMYEEALYPASVVTSIVFGAIVGYKLNTVLRTRKA